MQILSWSLGEGEGEGHRGSNIRIQASPQLRHWTVGIPFDGQGGGGALLRSRSKSRRRITIARGDWKNQQRGVEKSVKRELEVLRKLV